MATLKLSGIVTQISGKIGGQVLGTNQNGNYIKNNSYSQNRNTLRQQAQKQEIFKWSQLWRTTTQTQKNAWTTEAINYPYFNRVGDTVYYNGYQLANKLNASLIQINETPILTPPTFEAVSNLVLSNLSCNNSQVSFNFTNGVETNTYIFSATPPLPLGVQPQEKDFLNFTTLTSLAASGLILMSVTYFNFFGIVPANTNIWLRCRAVVNNNGNNTNFTTPIFCTAT
jgi:hypothetical protein